MTGASELVVGAVGLGDDGAQLGGPVGGVGRHDRSYDAAWSAAVRNGGPSTLAARARSICYRRRGVHPVPPATASDAARRVRRPVGVRRQPDRGAAGRPGRAARAAGQVAAGRRGGAGRAARCCCATGGGAPSWPPPAWRRSRSSAGWRRSCWASGLSEEVQLVAWAVVLVGAVVFALRARGALSTATLSLNVFTLILVGLTLLTIVPYESSRAVAAGHAADRRHHVHHRDPGARPGHLPHRARPVRLRVVARAPVRHHRQRPAGLARRPGLPGACPGARANYRATDFSLASMLSMEHARRVQRRPGPRLRRPDRGTVAPGAARRRGVPPGQRLHLLPARLLVRTDPDQRARGRDPGLGGLDGVRSGAPAVDHPARASTGSWGGRPARATSSGTVRGPGRCSSSGSSSDCASVPGRKFVFAHILLPHPPYVFDANGDPVVKATAEVQPEAELYANQLRFTNAQVRADGLGPARRPGRDRSHRRRHGRRGSVPVPQRGLRRPHERAPGHPVRHAGRVLPAGPARRLLPGRPHVA